eukprot:TRINITY_DN4824_c0_g1_i1.p1 TRINITY_DN4824_c0_g1~~TRINITY_DN4824_c0_g1_i1.p1  ORF type:complete len:427 (+),score=128.28 TRINITY_DN4824_c0_g1_i1:67-1347(+)
MSNLTPNSFLGLVPTLTQICMDAIANNFEEFSNLDGLDPKIKRRIIQKISLDLDPFTAASAIHDEDYWKRRSSKFHNATLNPYCKTWKNVYFTKFLEETIINSSKMDEEMKSIVNLCSNFVFSLELFNVSPELEIHKIIKLLPNLKCLKISNGPFSGSAQELVDNFVVSEIEKVKIKDGPDVDFYNSILMGIEGHENLVTLELRAFSLNDFHIQPLCVALRKNSSIERIDLSWNRITAAGVRHFAKLITHRGLFTHISLVDNDIQSEGCKYLANAFVHAKNLKLKHLNLRRNNIQDDGFVAILNGLIRGEQNEIETINLVDNNLTNNSFVQIPHLLYGLNKLETLVLSYNMFSADNYVDVLKRLQKNNSSVKLVVDNCGIPDDLLNTTIDEMLNNEQDLNEVVTPDYVHNEYALIDNDADIEYIFR